jgi:hypothetical protein
MSPKLYLLTSIAASSSMMSFVASYQTGTGGGGGSAGGATTRTATAATAMRRPPPSPYRESIAEPPATPSPPSSVANVWGYRRRLSPMSREEIRRRVGRTPSSSSSSSYYRYHSSSNGIGGDTGAGVLCEGGPSSSRWSSMIASDAAMGDFVIHDELASHIAHVGSLASSVACDPTCVGKSYYVPCSIVTLESLSSDDVPPDVACHLDADARASFDVDSCVDDEDDVVLAFNAMEVETNEMLVDFGYDDDDDVVTYWNDFEVDGMVFNAMGIETNEILVDAANDERDHRRRGGDGDDAMMTYARGTRIDAHTATSDVYLLLPTSSSSSSSNDGGGRRAWKFVIEYKIATINIGSIPNFDTGGGGITMPLLRPGVRML